MFETPERATIATEQKRMTTEEVHRGALIGEIDLLLDEHKHRKGKNNGKK